MANVAISVLPLREPIVDKDGRVSKIWGRYFYDLWNRTGGPSDMVGSIEIGKQTSADPLVVLFIDALQQVAEDNNFFQYNKGTHELLLGGATFAAAKIILNAASGLVTIRGDVTITGTETTAVEIVTGTFSHTGTLFGIFNTAPTTKTVVPDPSAIVTTETAGGVYTANEQDMLNHLKTDVTNLQSKLTDLINALQSYGAV